MNHFKSLFYCGIILAVLTSCAKDPIIADQAELSNTTDVEIRATVEGIYASMVHEYYMGTDYILLSEPRADITYSNGRANRFTTVSSMTIGSIDRDSDDALPRAYSMIYEVMGKANVILNSDFDNIELAEGSEADLKHAIGEAYVARAMAGFDLLRLWGQQFIDGGSNLGIIYPKTFRTTDLNDLHVPRPSVEENKKDIYDDIEEGIKFLKEGASSSYDSNKTNITIDAAYALKSTVGVYFGPSNPEDYQKAIEGAEQIIDTYSLVAAEDYIAYWADASPGEESIFELARSTDNNGGDTIDRMFRIVEGSGYGDIEVFQNFLEDAEFDIDNDVRASKGMIDFEGPRLRNMGKYPSSGTASGTDNPKKIRYAEVVLNYAEAILSKDPTKSLHYLNQIATARGAQPYQVSNMDNILKERRKEFMFEGLRFYDLARTGRDIPEMDPNTPNNHHHVPAGDPRFALPIPQHEIDSNPAMEPNPEY